MAAEGQYVRVRGLQFGERNVQAVLIAGLGVLGFVVAWPQYAVISAFLAAPAQGITQPGLDRAEDVVKASSPLKWAVAVTTATLLAAAGWSVRPWPVLAATAWLVICGVPLGFIDVRAHRLPDVLTGAAYAGVMTCVLVEASIAGQWGSAGRAALGGAVLAACYLTAAILRPGQVGLGDAKAAASAGSFTAWLSWQTLLAGTLVALLIAAGCALLLLATGRASLQTRIAYGPALLGGALLAAALATRAMQHWPI